MVSDTDALDRIAAALRASEERLQLATAAANLGIFDIDLITRAMEWDTRQRELWGVAPNVVITNEIFIAGIHPDDRDLVRAALARAFDPDGDHLYEAEYRLLPRSDDRNRWIAATGRVHFDGLRPVRLIGTVQDVSARKRAEMGLRELNEKLEERVAAALAERKLLADVFESTDAMMSVADPDLRLLAFNRPYADEIEQLGGRRPRVGDRIPDLYADRPELAAPVEANWSRAVLGEVFILVEEHGDATHYRRTYERRFEPLYDREGRRVGAYQYATDVTKRLQDQRRAAEAEAARREADALYRAYFENTAEALFIIGVLPDGGFTIEELNPAHQTATGLDIREVRGRRLEEQLPQDVAQAVSANYRRAAELGRPISYREVIELPGGLRHWDTLLVPVRIEDGRVVRIVGSARDVTAQVHAEEQVRQSQKMDAMGQLTGGVAHDFNNLLTPILGGLDRLQRRGLGTERDQRLIEGALQSAERAKTLVQRLLAFARRQPLQPRAVDVGELVKGMADLVGSTTGPLIKVAVEIEPDLSPALADANQLEMAILNLAVNARDAMPEGGTLRISATSEVIGLEQSAMAAAPGRYVRLSVADTGIGMDEATLARAVEPFFSTKGIGRGTGLGLSMVQGLAGQLGGALTLHSQPGLGTNVDLWLPIAAEEAAAAPSPPVPSGEDVPARSRGAALLGPV
jgi:PAS domain S-box-containing protein